MLNWDEINKKELYPKLPKTVTPTRSVLQNTMPKQNNFQSVLDEYNISLPGIGNQIAKTLPTARKQEIAQGTQRFFEQAPIQAGFMQEVALNNPAKSLERKLGTDIDTSKAEASLPYKIGQTAGIMAQFAVPYAGASKGIGALTAKAFPKLGKIGQGVARSVATDISVGLPLNVNYALNKQGLRGAEAAKNIGINTAIDLITGGILEAVPVILKSGKKIASKAEFDALPAAEKQEVILRLTGPTEPQKLLSEGINWGEPIRPDFYVNRGGVASPDVSAVQIAGELPVPAKINPSFNATRRPLSDPYKAFNAEYDRAVKSIADYIRNYKGKGVDIEIIAKNGDELMRDGGYRNTVSRNDQWYQDFYKANGRAPLKSEAENVAKELIDDSLRRGRGEFFDEDLYNLLQDARYSETVLPRINRKIPRVVQAPQIPKTNREVPFTVTRGEMSAQALPKATPNIPAQAPSKPVQPVLPKKGDIPPAGVKSVSADTFKGEKTIDELVQEYGALPKGEQPRAREVEIPKKTDYGDVQKHARTLQESAIVDETLFKDINEAITQGSFTKPTKSNKTAVENANFTLEQAGLDGAMNKFRSVLAADKTPTSEDIALGNRVLQELQKEGRYGDALDVAIDLSQMLSETGRTLQAARIAKRLSPEGRLLNATRIADKISKKTGKKVTLSDETIEAITNAKTEKEVIEANHKAAVELWNQTPPNWIDKVNSWRYMAMLFNPKTHMRNIVGNALFVPAREFKNLIGAGLERALIKDGVRTKAVLNPAKDKALLDFASKDFQNVKALLKNEGKLDDNVRNLDAKVFNTKVLEGIRKLNLGALDAEDTWFMKFAYDSSLAQYMKANKITPDKMVGETLEAGRKYAMNEALKATYRDFNALSNLISRGKAAASSGKYGLLGRVGGIALEGAIPFSKTPLNLIKRGVAYSPANLVRGIVNLGRVKSGKVTATEAIDQLASGLSGSALLGLGTFLGYHNIVTGKEGEYKDKLYNYNQMLGSQNYALNIGGDTYTIDWAAPLSMPFFVGVELAKAIKDNNADLAAVLDAMTQISDPMVNLSMLKGINDIMTNNFEGFGQTAFDIGTGYAGQFNPTLFGQIARTMDDTRRSTISTAETGTMKGIEKFGRKQLAKLPVATKKLEPYVDLWGREQKTDGVGRRVVENFLSPGYFKQENVTPVDRELQSLMKGMDEETIKKILPTSTAYQYTIQSAGLPYRMTEKESTAYQKTRGQESYKGLEKLFKSAEYRKMTQEEKVKAIQDVYSAAHQKAKYEYFESKGLPVTLALDKEYQEKFRSLKGQISDKRFYSAVTDMKGKSRDIEKVFAAEQRGKVSDRFFEAFKISEESVEKARALKSAGLTADQYTKAMDGVKDMESDKLPNGKAIDNSLSKKKKAYIDSAFPNASDEQLKLLYELAGVSKTIGHYRPRFE